MSSYFVTGAGRGLGLGLVSQLVQLPPSQVSVVFAASRSSPTSDLQRLIDSYPGRVVPINVIITDRTSIDKAVAEIESSLAGRGLDVLINNAGVMPAAFEGIEKMDNLRYALEVNVEAVQETTAALMPLLRKGKGKQIVNMYVVSEPVRPNPSDKMSCRSTTAGSMGKASNFAAAPFPAYKVSKAALNMLTVQYAFEYAKEGFRVYAVSPGVRIGPLPHSCLNISWPEKSDC